MANSLRPLCLSLSYDLVHNRHVYVCMYVSYVCMHFYFVLYKPCCPTTKKIDHIWHLSGAPSEQYKILMKQQKDKSNL